MMSDKELIERGMAAQRVLGDATIMGVIDALAYEQSLALTNSLPHEKQKREECYHLIRACKEIIKTLRQRVEIAEATVANQKALEEQEQDEKELDVRERDIL